MQIFLLINLFLIHYTLLAQLNCTTQKKDNQVIKTCYHFNKKISTIETWDKDKREGHIKGYNCLNKELFSYFLRTYAGHASVNLNYHPNGQVSKAEYRSAPDGGIQFYHIISTFDKNGNQTSYVDLSQPDGHPVLTQPNFMPPKEIIHMPKLYMHLYEIKNKTPLKLFIHINAISEQVRVKDTLLILYPKQKIIIDSLAMQYFLKNDSPYQIEIVQKSKKKKKLIPIYALPTQTAYRKNYIWYIVED